MKKSILFGLILVGSSVFAGEPYLLKTQPEEKIIKSSPVFPRKVLRNANGQSNVVIKLNITQLVLQNISLMAEWGFHNKMSVGLGMSFKIDGQIPSQLYSPDSSFAMPNYKGFSVTPEFRFYPGGKDEKSAPKGFYIAAYVRYSKYVLTQEATYQETPTSPVYTGDGEHTIVGASAGLMLGQQWIIGKHFSIDWWILGGGAGKSNYSYSWYCPEANLTDAQQQDLKNHFTEYFKSFTAFDTTPVVSTTPQSATTSVSGLPWASVRMGLCLGFAF